MYLSDDSKLIDELLDRYVHALEQGADEPTVEDLVKELPENLRPELRLRCQEEQAVRGFFRQRSGIVAPEIGQVVEGMEIVEELGQGGMGQVFKAWDPRLKRHVAIKFVHVSLAWREDVLARIESEGQALAKIDHPGIARVLSVGEQGGLPYMVMNLVEGQPFDRWMAARSSEKTEDRVAKALQVVIDVLGSLALAHEAGIVHRDIKPDNILVTEDGHAVLIDFGIAVIPGGRRPTRSGTVVGSPAYMSPERLEFRSAAQDFAGDQWGAAVVLFEALCGDLPFGDDLDDLSTIKAVREDPTPSLRERLPDIRPSLDLVLKRALHKDPRERYRGVLDFAADLRAVLESRPRDVKASRWLVRIGRRGRRALAFIPLVVIALAFLPGQCGTQDESEGGNGTALRAGFGGGPSQGPSNQGRLSARVFGLASDVAATIHIESLQPPTGIRSGNFDVHALPLVDHHLARGDYHFIVTVPDGRRCEIKRSFTEPGALVTVDLPASDLVLPDTSNMITIPAGPAWIGRNLDGEDAYAYRQESVPSFRIDRDEVTCAQWRTWTLQSGASAPWGDDSNYDPAWDQLPILGLSWAEADAYARAQGKRLPTWSEWQKAARGTEGWEFPWGNGQADEAALRAVVGRKLGPGDIPRRLPWRAGAGETGPLPIGSRTGDISPSGARDMFGNAVEWTGSFFAQDSQDGPIVNRAAHVISGGGWRDSLNRIDTASPGRIRLDMTLFGPFEAKGPGFRCAMTLE